MKLSKELEKQALEIYKVLESIQTPNDIGNLVRRKRPNTSNTNRSVKPRCEAPKAAPTYAPQEHRSQTENEYLFAMCFHVEGLFGNQHMLDKPEQINLIIDSGASVTITPFKEDFVSKIRPAQAVTLKGIAGGCDVEGIGTVEYLLPRQHQPPFKLRIEDVIYVPSCPSRLVCPQQLHEMSVLKGRENASFSTYEGGATLLHEGEAFHFNLHHPSKLPVLKALRQKVEDLTMTQYAHEASLDLSNQEEYMDPNALPEAPHPPQTQPQPAIGLQRRQEDTPCEGATSTEDNTSAVQCEAIEPLTNLTRSQRELLDLHIKLGHMDMQTIQTMIRRRVVSAPNRVANLKVLPKCQACLQGKAHQRSHNENNSVIGKDHTKPGAGVSVDHVEAGTPGYIWQTKGAPTHRRYKYFSLYVDHDSRFLYPFFQEGKTAAETLKGKHAFEAFAKAKGVSLHHIHTDNGVFNSDLYKSDIASKNQTISFCGVNAHWQNGIVERYNGVICAAARTMLLHAQSHWPEIITAEFWPFAVQHAVNLYNSTPSRRITACPWTRFTACDPPWNIADFKPLFCPVYVLDRRLQEGNNLPKWSKRAEIGVYVGHSHQYAGSVPLIWNPKTKLVSPQFHVVFDERFETVSPQILARSEPEQNQELFERLFATSTWSYRDNSPYEHPYFFDSPWQRPSVPDNPQRRTNPRAGARTNETHNPVPVLHVPEGAEPVAKATPSVARVTARSIGTQTEASVSRKAGGHHEGENSSGTTTDPVEAVSAQQPGLNSPPHEDDLSSQVDVLDDDNSVTLIDQPASNALQDRIQMENRNTLSQSDKDHIAIISQLAYPSDSLYAFNAPLYAKAQGILMQTASIPKGP